MGSGFPAVGGGAGRAGARGRRRRGSAATATVAAVTRTVGSTTSRKPCGAWCVAISARPAPIRLAALTALVRKNNPPERWAIQRVGAPVRWISLPTMASPPVPPPGRSAPEASSVHARACVSTRESVEEQPEQHDEAQLGGELESSRERDPHRVDVADRVQHSPQSGGGERQREREHNQQAECGEPPADSGRLSERELDEPRVGFWIGSPAYARSRRLLMLPSPGGASGVAR